MATLRNTYELLRKTNLKTTSKHRSQNQWGENNTSYKHGATHSPEYYSWKAMKQRCTNPKDPSYKNYGGRGITVCKAWLDFAIFIMDMGKRPAGFTLSRIDNDGPYCRSNCKWESPQDQAKNTRRSIYTKEVLQEALELKKAGYSYRAIDRHFGSSLGSAWYSLRNL